jgi:hypothetical protein
MRRRLHTARKKGGVNDENTPLSPRFPTRPEGLDSPNPEHTGELASAGSRAPLSLPPIVSRAGRGPLNRFHPVEPQPPGENGAA